MHVDEDEQIGRFGMPDLRDLLKGRDGGQIAAEADAADGLAHVVAARAPDIRARPRGTCPPDNDRSSPSGCRETGTPSRCSPC